ncbi:tRNA-specific adenosine deaminase 1 [Harpegnathos saltator]|uniref:tRNA-specific adenosine deaminase 1 n=1 Tax=Harpegnathos saltator TaxID=610380 RepID=E2B4R0_HARSA|nr:tRNA-specific adenosine deaminase 1 [Harpegnathos saltator]EFN89341.1 tRNA-specific adenosine deaminase 1 [Harpegnathos saltator]
MRDFADSVAKLCIDKYNSLKKTGKPTINEWTVLCGIILKDASGSLHLVALATGTKCLGESELTNSPQEERGSRLSDSHAEVLTRRAFIRYLYDQIDLTLSGSDSTVFKRNDKNKIELNSAISFHFFSSQTPCGDCSIFLKEKTSDDNGPPSKIRRLDENEKIITESFYKDIYRTGAKCMKEEQIQDSYLPGINYHIVGPLRTKPGRGDPTKSLSCSDKIAKWLILGLQGSFLSLMIPSIRLESITIGGGCPFSFDAMERGLYKRFNNKMHNPKIFQAKLSFIHKKGQERYHPCPSSIIWFAGRNSVLEVAVAGRKQGMTKKKKGNSLFISRRMLLQTFLQVLDKHPNYYSEIKHPKKITYYDWKQWSIVYQNKWRQLQFETFQNWPYKPVNSRNFAL